MPIYAIAETVPERNRGYITPGKRYEVLNASDGGFYCMDDRGDAFYAHWEASMRLNGGNWTRIDEPDEAPAPDPRDALMAELAEALRACEAFLFPSSGRGTKFNGGIDDAEQLTLAALAKYEGANK